MLLNMLIKLDLLKKIRYQLEKAYHLSMTRRKGPVLIDVPDDIRTKK